MNVVRKCESVEHRGDNPPPATVAIIYHDFLTNGVVGDLDPSIVEPGADGTETAYLCAACAGSNEISGSVSALVIRTMAL